MAEQESHAQMEPETWWHSEIVNVCITLPEVPHVSFFELSLLLLVTQSILIDRLEKELHTVKKEHL